MAVTLKRNPSLINSIWVRNGLTVMTKKSCQIIIPYRYLAYQLAKISEKTLVAGVFLVSSGGEYFIINVCAWLWITPSSTEQKKIGNEEFMIFNFDAGSIVIPDLTTVKDSDLLYDMNKYFYSNARIPYFLEYDDVGKLFMYHKEYGGLNISSNNIPFEMVTSVIAHDPTNMFNFYRNTPMDKSPVFVPFKSVLFNTTSTVAKLLGANLEDGVTSALLSPSKQAEDIELLLKR